MHRFYLQICRIKTTWKPYFPINNSRPDLWNTQTKQFAWYPAPAIHKVRKKLRQRYQRLFTKITRRNIYRNIIVSFDVENLYSNIPHELGLEAIAFWLNKYPTELPSRISNDFVLDGMKLILENNNFCINDAYFLQTKGTAMGTKLATIYANLVLAYLEKKYIHVNSQKKDFDLNFKN